MLKDIMKVLLGVAMVCKKLEMLTEKVKYVPYLVNKTIFTS